LPEEVDEVRWDRFGPADRFERGFSVEGVGPVGGNRGALVPSLEVGGDEIVESAVVGECATLGKTEVVEVVHFYLLEED